MNTFTSIIVLLVMTVNFNAQQKNIFSSASSKKYCYILSTGKYELSLEDGGSNKSYYKLYNSNGDLVKTMQGSWEIRDEGVYGSLYVLTIRWSGLNENLPNLKFTCQYNSNGQLLQLVDNQKRNWYPCY